MRFPVFGDVVSVSAHVDRQFERVAPDELWGTDITQHPTRDVTGHLVLPA